MRLVEQDADVVVVAVVRPRGAVARGVASEDVDKFLGGGACLAITRARARARS